MLLFLIIAALTIAIIAVVFALQNADIILVTFLIWKLEGSLALILLLTFATGVIVSLLILLPRIIKGSLTVSNQKKKIKEFKIKLEEKKEEVSIKNNSQQPPI